jgi:transposase
MKQAYSNDFREHAMSLHFEKGMRIDEASKFLKVGQATYYRWIALQKQTGGLSPKKKERQGYDHKVLKEEYDEFRKFLNDNRGKNAIELAQLWKRPIAASTMRKWIKRVGFTLKKNNIYMKKEMRKNANNS